LARYGKHLGTAYQLIDDVLDYRSDPATRGKNLGDDLAEGKPTLPLLHALRHGNDEQRALDPPRHRAGRARATRPYCRGHRDHGLASITP
jgi:geranylgeranyl pyrophosphate synthase